MQIRPRRSVRQLPCARLLLGLSRRPMSTIRRQVTVEASPRTVWTALTTAEGLKGWLADEASTIPSAMGRFSVTMEGDDGAPVEEFGRFSVFRPTSKLEIAFEKVGKGAWKGTTLSFTIARENDETVVNMVHTGTPFIDDTVRKTHDDNWRRALTSLRDSLEA